MTKQVSMFVVGLLIGGLVTTAVYAFVVRGQSASEAGVTNLTLATSLPAKHPVNIALERMADIVNKESGGKLTISVQPNGTLGSESDYVENMQNGALAMAKVSAAAMETFVPKMKVFDLPYLFKSEKQYWDVLHSKLGQQLLLAGEKSGLHGLCYLDAGSRNFYTRHTPILKPSDLQGLKIRVQKSPVARAMVSALGGSPTPVPWGNLFSDLQQGVVDGAENNTPSFVSSHQDEVCKQFSFDGHTRVPDVLLISTTIWNSLSKHEQAILVSAAHQAAKYERKLWKKRTAAAVKTMKDNGVHVYYPDIKPFMKQTQSVRDQYKSDPVIGPLMTNIEAIK